MFPNALADMLNNRHIWVALFACVSAQGIKVLIEYAFTQKLDKALLFSTGGMPSSHSAFVVALALSIGTMEGLNSPVFALAFVFACIVMYDAAGVRRATGKHAQVINDLMDRLKKIGVKPDKKLKEILGHSPVEVVGGAIWGSVVVALAYWLMR